MTLADEDLRHRAPARALNHLCALFRLLTDIDLLEGRTLLRQQRAGALAIRAPGSDIQHDDWGAHIGRSVARQGQILSAPRGDAAAQIENLAVTLLRQRAYRLRRRVALIAVEDQSPLLVLLERLDGAGQLRGIEMARTGDVAGRESLGGAQIMHRGS